MLWRSVAGMGRSVVTIRAPVSSPCELSGTTSRLTVGLRSGLPPTSIAVVASTTTGWREARPAWMADGRWRISMLVPTARSAPAPMASITRNEPSAAWEMTTRNPS